MNTLPLNPVKKLKSTLFKFNHFIKSQHLPTQNMSGQALPIVFITLAVVAVGILYATSKTIVDVETTSLEEEALRAFSAAEAGVEEALLSQEAGSGTLPGTDTAFTTTFTVPDASDTFVHPDSLVSGEIATFWFTERTPDGDFTCDGGKCYRGPKLNNVCWGTQYESHYDPGKKPAIELIVYYDLTGGSIASPNDYSGVEVARRTFDPDSSRRISNNFDPATELAAGSPCVIGDPEDPELYFETGQIIFNSSPIGFPGSNLTAGCGNTSGCILMLKVKMLYNDDSGGTAVPDRVGIDAQATAGFALAPQGNVIESTGTSGRAVRKFEVFQGHVDPPPVFENAVFSYEDLTK